MKGTPFYTGEYEVREGPAADRVNLWPILYYRDPALSVLWPIMEFSPDHLAIRPVYSVYGRESATPVYNVVWPIARFDTKKQDYRVFPIYWGDGYFTAFPLYWHKGHPLSGKGCDSLFPLWIYSNSGSGSSMHIFWPLYARFNHSYHHGWRLWPIYGTNDRLDGENSWWLSSLAYAYERDNETGHGLIPLYGSKSTATCSAFYSIPYSREIASEAGAKSWDLALPIWYRAWEGTTNAWGAIPLLSWGRNAPTMKDNWYAAGLVRSASAESVLTHHVLPFYVFTKTAERDGIYSLPWWSEHRTDGTGWNASFPFYYGSWSTNSSVAVTPLYAQKKLVDGSKAWSCYIPFVYFDRTKDAHFMTLLGGAWCDGDEHRWIALPLLSGGKADAESGKTVWVAGLAGRKWSPDGRSSYVFPLYYSAPGENRFESLLYATRPVGENQQTEIPVLLSGWRVGDDYALNFVLLGMWLSESRGGEKTKSQLIPFYAWERDTYFYTALYGHGDRMKYYLTPVVGSYSGGESGNWVWPVYRHRIDAKGNIDGRYLLLGSYSKSGTEKRNGFWGIYRFREWEQPLPWKGADQFEKKRHLDYLLLGKSHDDHVLAKGEGECPDVLKRRKKKERLFPLWRHELLEDFEESKREESSAWLLALSDSRTEKQTDRDYTRRRILWRLWHYEKLNGDSSVDVFPGITIDSYVNGYRKVSVLWRLFRYEKDPETGKTKADFLFIPVSRKGG